MTRDVGAMGAEDGDGGNDLAWLSDRLDRHGSDFARWPDASAAQRARQVILAEPEARRLWDEAKALDRLLSADRDAFDSAFAPNAARVEAAVMAKLPAGSGDRRAHRPLITRLAVGMAAAWFVGIALGAVTSEMGILVPEQSVSVDSLIFGPEEFDLS